MLHVTRRLYNAALQERRDAWKFRGKSVTAKMQYAELTALRRGESLEKAFLLRVVWLDQSRRRSSGVGAPASGRVAAHERVIVGEHPARVAGRGLRTRTTI
jgi:hypothetical protein